MRVTFILHKFSRGGSDRVAAYLARGFTDRGMKVDLVAFARGGEVEAILSELAGEDIPILYLGRAFGPRPLDLVRGLPGLIRMLRREKPDAIISTANNTALVSAIAFRLARLTGSRLFLKTTNPIATSRHTGMARRFRLWTYRIIFRWTTAVWTLSPQESEEMRQEYPEFPHLFHDVANPYVTPAMLADPPVASRPAANGKTIICVARLTAQKRLDLLIAAFAHVHSPGARLLILGEGELRPELEAMIVALGLGDRISMPGYVTNVAAALHAADLFVLPSEYEGLPAVVLEAMAANCPVLSTDCFPAARALLDHAEGCAIVDDTEPRTFAALIDAHLLSPRPSRLRSHAELFSIENGVTSHRLALEQEDHLN